MPSDQPGLYQHYRGDYYRLLHVAEIMKGRPMPHIRAIMLLAGSLSEDRTEPFALFLEQNTGQLFAALQRPSEAYPEGSKVAVYASLARGSVWARPFSMWCERVELVPGSYRDRFEYIGQTLPEHR